MKSKNTIITLAVVLGLFGVLFFISAPSVKNNENLESRNVLTSKKAINLIASEKTFNFGNVSMADGIVSHNITLKNNGEEPVIISKVYTSCMCTSASITTKGGTDGPFGMQGHKFIPTIKQVIAPGEDATLDIMFNPAAHGPAGVGRVERIVYLESENKNPFEVGFTATVTP